MPLAPRLEDERPHAAAAVMSGKGAGITVDLFGNGDLLLRSPHRIVLDPASATVEAVLQAARDSGDLSMRSASRLFSLSRARIITDQQLLADPAVVVSSDNTCLPRIDIAVTAYYRARTRVATTEGHGAASGVVGPGRSSGRSLTDDADQSPVLRSRRTRQAQGYHRLLDADREARDWIAESLRPVRWSEATPAETDQAGAKERRADVASPAALPPASPVDTITSVRGEGHVGSPSPRVPAAAAEEQHRRLLAPTADSDDSDSVNDGTDDDVDSVVAGGGVDADKALALHQTPDAAPLPAATTQGGAPPLLASGSEKGDQHPAAHSTSGNAASSTGGGDPAAAAAAAAGSSGVPKRRIAPLASPAASPTSNEDSSKQARRLGLEPPQDVAAASPSDSLAGRRRAPSSSPRTGGRTASSPVSPLVKPPRAADEPPREPVGPSRQLRGSSRSNRPLHPPADQPAGLLTPSNSALKLHASNPSNDSLGAAPPKLAVSRASRGGFDGASPGSSTYASVQQTGQRKSAHADATQSSQHTTQHGRVVVYAQSPPASKRGADPSHQTAAGPAASRVVAADGGSATKPLVSDALERRRRDWASTFEAQGMHVPRPGGGRSGGGGGRGKEVMFHRQIAAKLLSVCSVDDVVTRGHPLRLWIVGPEGSGRSEAACVAVAELLSPHLTMPMHLDAGDPTVPSTVVLSVPVAVHRHLPDSETDVAVWFSRFIQHVVQCVAVARPSFAAHASRIAAFWKTAVARRDAVPPVDPRVAADLLPGADAEWRMVAAHLQHCYRRAAFDDFVAAVWRTVTTVRDACGLQHTVYVIDDVDALGTKVLSDWRTSRRVDLDILTTLLRHLQESDVSCIGSCVVAPSPPAPGTAYAVGHSGGGLLPVSTAVVATCGMVSDAAAAEDEGLPMQLVCGEKTYSLRIFGGCPGFLSVLKRHLARGRALRPLGDGRAEVADAGLRAVLDELALLRLDDLAAARAS